MRGSWLLGLAFGLLLVPGGANPARTQSTGRPVQRLEAVAETRLLMEGAIHPNFKGLENTLKDKPTALDSWVFARGQALIIAENGNLLLLRPPRNQGQDTWLQLAADLRQQGTTLARHAAARDYPQSRQAFLALARTCNRCHQTFRVNVKIEPFAPEEKKSP